MKFIVFILIIATSCKDNLNGVWVDSKVNIAIKFSNDTAFTMSPYSGDLINDTSLYFLKNSTIEFMDMDSPDQKYIYKYKLRQDSLIVWTGINEYRNTFIKTDINSYRDYFLHPGFNKIILPKSDNARNPSNDYDYLDIKISFESEQPIFYFEERTIPINNLSDELTNFSITHSKRKLAYRIFADERLPCEFTLGLLKYLRPRGTVLVYFMTTDKSDNENDINLKGLGMLYNLQQEIIEVPNMR